MKIIFFSDLHKDISSLKRLLEVEDGCYYCLGDSELSKDILQQYNITSVKGNCDSINLEDNIIIELGAKKVLLTHGHNFNVKYSLNNLYYYAKSIFCDIVIYGHTHQVTQVIEDVEMYNPGSLRDGQTYLVYENNQMIFKKLR